MVLPVQRRPSVADDAITTIRGMILDGRLAPGDRLPAEGHLAATLGLSRTSLREAVRALTVLGVVVTRQGDASYISSLGPELLLGALGLAVDLQREDTMPDLVAVRRILEPAATALAATRITADELDELRGHLPPDPPAASADDLIELDQQFHRGVARASGNPLLVALLEGLTAPTMRMRVWRGLTVPGVQERARSEHAAIVEALAARDPGLALAAATVHVAGVQAWVDALEPGWSTLAARELRGPAALHVGSPNGAERSTAVSCAASHPAAGAPVG